MTAAATPAASGDDYLAFADALVHTGLVSDPWIDGRPRFDPRPCWLAPGEARAMASAAARVAAAIGGRTWSR